MIPKTRIKNSEGSDCPSYPSSLTLIFSGRLPKTKLDAGYLGDGTPLCADLPPRDFLAKGARFLYTGAASVEGSTV